MGAASRKKNEIDIQIGKRLKEIRKTNGLTQEQMAERIGISYSYWVEIENGYKGITKRLLIHIVHMFNVSTDYILTGYETTSNYSSSLVNIINEFPEDKRADIIIEIIRFLKIFS